LFGHAKIGAREKRVEEEIRRGTMRRKCLPANPRILKTAP